MAPPGALHASGRHHVAGADVAGAATFGSYALLKLGERQREFMGKITSIMGFIFINYSYGMLWSLIL